MSFRMQPWSENPWEPKRYDLKTADPDDEGLFYDGHTLCSIHLYWDDDEVDYDEGYLGCLTCFYELGNHYQENTVYGLMFGDGLWTGYKSVAECIEGEWGTKNTIYKISDEGYDCSTIAELAHELYQNEDIDLSLAIQRIDGLLGINRVKEKKC